MRCSTCRFFQPYQASDDEDELHRQIYAGVCRRYPPVLEPPRYIRLNEIGARHDAEMHSTWPPVHKNDWCGEYEKQVLCDSPI